MAPLPAGGCPGLKKAASERQLGLIYALLAALGKSLLMAALPASPLPMRLCPCGWLISGN